MTISKWIAIEFEIDASNEELAAWLMMSQGALGCETTDAVDDHVRIKATFATDIITNAKLAELKEAMKEHGLSFGLNSWRMQEIPEQDWSVEWRKGLVPFAIGDKFLICPPWLQHTLKDSDTAGRHLILIEPGMAFGTGLHATTQYCLKTLGKIEIGSDVLDIGTGSGILAIATAMLHPSARISGADIHADAVKVAQENVQLNGVSDQIKLFEGSTEIFDNQSFDCILSNLTCEDIISLLLEFLRLLRPNGVVICAGILSEKVPLLEKAIASYPLSIVDTEIGSGWAGITLGRIPVTVKAK